MDIALLVAGSPMEIAFPALSPIPTVIVNLLKRVLQYLILEYETHTLIVVVIDVVIVVGTDVVVGKYVLLFLQF